MNRLQLAAKPPTEYSSFVDQSVAVSNPPPPASSTPHALFGPMHYEAGYSYPLILWLHGPGDDEKQLQRVMPLISMRNYVAIGPRGSSADESVARAYRWRQEPEDILLAEQRVLESIELAADRFHVAPHRVFIAGFQCGGTMAMRVGLKHPERFAGVISIGGPFPRGNTPLANVSVARGMPLFIAHGETSEEYPVSRVCRELKLLHSAGFKVNLRQYPCGDDLTTQMLHDLDRWIMEQVTGMPSTCDEHSLRGDGSN